VKAAIWSRRAKTDLDRIWLAIARHDVAAADRVAASIESRVALLREFPHIGPPHEHGHRKLVVERYPYVLRYAVTEDAILILAVHHMAQNRG
jgi:plasmid stabilization system protein ParE